MRRTRKYRPFSSEDRDSAGHALGLCAGCCDRLAYAGFPYSVALLTDAVLKIEAADGALSEVPLRAGQSYRHPDGIEHDVMNGSPHPIAFRDSACSR